MNTTPKKKTHALSHRWRATSSFGLVWYTPVINRCLRIPHRTYRKERATKLVYSIKHLNYEQRLKKLRIPTLKYRRIRGDLEVYKIIGNYNNHVNCALNFNNTRGNSLKLLQGRP